MTENITVLVTGASGTLGTAVVPRLVKDGHDVRQTSRSARPGWVTADLRTGAGVAAAVRGASAIVHLASSPGRPQQTDVEGTRRLVEAAGAAGVRHLLYVSVAGIDRVPFRYYRAKLDTEAVVRASGLPFTILRATQFHLFVEQILTVSSRLGPVITDPDLLIQPVAVEDVADRIAELLGAPATGATFDFGGPAVVRLGDLARAWLTARGSRRPIWGLRLPGHTARAIRAGGLTAPGAETGTRTWRDYLAAKY
jgi:uncharacterized protein YbjT (DUF2867 family)